MGSLRRRRLPLALTGAAAVLLLGCESDRGARWYGLQVTPGREIEETRVAPVAAPPGERIEFPDVRAAFAAQDTTPQEPEPPRQAPPPEEAEPPPGPPPPVPPGCAVQQAFLNYNGRTHTPLVFPVDLTSPAPGQQSIPARRVTGPSVGPIPGTSPQEFEVGNSFEFHADLNDTPGCTSRQFMARLSVIVHKATGRVGTILDDDSIGTGDTQWLPDEDASYQGNTQTGIRRIRGGFVYEGQPAVIHWLDTPGDAVRLDPTAAPFAGVRIVLLRSVVFDSAGGGGWHCYSGHTIIVDFATGAPIAPAAARTLVDSLAPNNPGNAAQARAARVLRTPAASGGFQGTSSPEFRDLGCSRF